MPVSPKQLVSEQIAIEHSLSEYFELGKQETISPFIIPSSRHWSANLTLRAALISAALLTGAFFLSLSPATLPFSNLLLVFVYFLAGIPSLIESIEDLADGDINIDILMTLAAFSSVFIGSGMEGALLLVLFALSGSMEDAVTDKAKGAINALHKLSPTKAAVIEIDGSIIERSIKDIPVGTTILVRAGQVVPLDGTVTAGSSSVNLSHLSGESLPVTKTVGDEVPAGGQNLDGALTLSVTRTSTESTLSRIIQLVTRAQEARPKLQRWFESFSRTYAMSIIGCSALFALILPFILSIPFLGPEGSLYRALAFLIAASPCALIIAIPIAYLSAISACARSGILLKGGFILDSLAKCSAVAFDKTGTLTTGELSLIGIEGIVPLSEQKERELLSIAYSLEVNAIHPIAKAIVIEAENKGVKGIPVKNFKAEAGFGIEATVDSPHGIQTVVIGRPSYVAEKLDSQNKKHLDIIAKEREASGEILAAMMLGPNFYIFRFSDTLRPNIQKTISNIEEKGWSTVMLTGDHETNAKRVAQEVGLTEYHADLSPEDKLSYVTKISEEKGLVMIGDGINDAPALARATVGICMGKVGTTTAVEAADVVLLRDNIDHLDWLIDKARLTKTIVKQNLTLAVAAIFVAALPALGGFIPLWLAVVLHEGGTVLVGLNALRLLKSKK